MRPDQLLYHTEHVILVLTLAAGALALLVRKLGSTRPGLAIGAAIGVGLGLRVSAAAVVPLIDQNSTLRGSDEAAFIYHGALLAEEPFFSAQRLHSMAGDLHEWVFALQFDALGDPSDLGLRVVQVALGVAALAIVAAAVYDLAGAHAASLVAWVLAFEPTNLFFSTLLHKEALLFLAEGLAVLGATRVWQRSEMSGAVLAAVGIAIAFATRPYAGWFLLGGVTLVGLHAALRARHARPERALVWAGVIVSLTLCAIPLVNLYAEQGLRQIGISQTANASDYSNLSLAPADFSSWGGVARSAPIRIRDVLLRPYPWQVENRSQQLGLIGTSIAWSLLVFFLVAAVGRGRDLVQRGAPFLYPLALLTLAYALSVGNAGTGFRYRTHLLLLMIALAGVLLRHRTDAATRTERVRPTSLPGAGRAPA